MERRIISSSFHAAAREPPLGSYLLLRLLLLPTIVVFLSSHTRVEWGRRIQLFPFAQRISSLADKLFDVLLAMDGCPQKGVAVGHPVRHRERRGERIVSKDDERSDHNSIQVHSVGELDGSL